MLAPEFFQNTSVLLDIREISNYVLEISERDSLIGPTGHSYAVTKDTFRNVFTKHTLFSFLLVLSLLF